MSSHAFLPACLKCTHDATLHFIYARMSHATPNSRMRTSPEEKQMQLLTAQAESAIRD